MSDKAHILSRTFCVAPMMDWTDRHDRYFLRLITERALLYTEMITTGAILHGDKDRLLGFHDAEHPIALQIGGSDPGDMARSAVIAEQYGYDEVNINCGCPSDRVQSGSFGACLMQEPDTVAACVDAMQSKVDIPVTVKCRIGVDDQDEEIALFDFVEKVADAGCEIFIVHARKAWLKGLSPKENRDIPPLNYPLVHRLKAERPDLEIIINGGIMDLDATAEELTHVDGVMVGRAAYQNPWVLRDVDERFYGKGESSLTRHDVVEQLVPYIDTQLARGVPLKSITRHLMGLFNGLPGARAWRRHLAENAFKPDAGSKTLLEAAAFVPSDKAVAA